MRNLLTLCSLVVVSLPLVAVAQPPPPPPPPPGGGGGGGGTGMEATEPKMQLGVGLIAGLPQGDFSDNVDVSPGINLDFAYMVIPNVSIKAGIRYFAIQVKNEDGFDYSNYDFDVGGRYTFPISSSAKAFGEAMLIYSTVAADDGNQSQSESGVGFGARGGGYFAIGGGRTSIGGAISYTTASIDFQGFSFDAAWLGIEGFASFGF